MSLNSVTKLRAICIDLTVFVWWIPCVWLQVGDIFAFLFIYNFFSDFDRLFLSYLWKNTIESLLFLFHSRWLSLFSFFAIFGAILLYDH